MTYQITKEDQSKMDELVEEFKKSVVTGGEVSMMLIAEWLEKQAPEWISGYSKSFKVWGHAGIIPAVRQSLKEGSADPLYEYVLATATYILIAPAIISFGTKAALVFILGYVAKEVVAFSSASGEWLAENQDKIIYRLRDTIYGWSDKLSTIIGSDFDYAKAVYTLNVKKEGFFKNEYTLTITDGNKVYKIDDDGDSSILGTPNEDVIYLGDGWNVVNAGRGNDIIYGGKDNDTIYGGEGHDIIEDKGGKYNVLDGGTGRDIIMSGKGNNRIDLGNDNDVDTVIVDNAKGYTDEIYNFTDTDNIIVRGGIKEIKVEGNVERFLTSFFNVNKRKMELYIGCF